MRPAVVMTPGLPPLKQAEHNLIPLRMDKMDRRRMAAVALVLFASFGAIAAQLTRLGFRSERTVQVSMASPLSQHFARPDIVDRKGRLLAGDVLMPSLFADPAVIVDLDEVVEKLITLFPDLNEKALRRKLSNRRRRFVWLHRRLTPADAQQVYDLGLPGLAFRRELRRVYPTGALAGHVLGHVDVDNRGIAGVERYIDNEVGVEPTHRTTEKLLAPVVLSLDLGVQHGLHSELSEAMRRFKAKGASGIVLDVTSGEIVAAVSLPNVDPAKPSDALKPGLQDKLAGGTFELGSIFKAMTVAMALDGGQALLGNRYDVTKPVMVGRKAIADTHGPGRPLSIREIFVYSSNVGAAMIGLEAGTTRQQAFLQKMGLLEPIKTEAGPVARPALPKIWNNDATTTISYGHGLAVAPLQFAAAAAALVNGGHKIEPTFLPTIPQDGAAPAKQVISQRTSMKLREVMRLNVTGRHGTGRKARARGYRVGGKTGTAEIPGVHGYAKKAVISSFLGAFPMNNPKYLTLVTLYEPQGTAQTNGKIVASVNAAPTTARLITRIAPLLGVLPGKMR